MSIKTTYKGIKMRSMLEARWTRFFDLLGWEWEYEPFDLNGWIPDFALHTKGIRGVNEDTEHPDEVKYTKPHDTKILVEIKPFGSEEEWGQEKQTILKALKSENLEYEVLLLGTTPLNICDCMDTYSLGYFYGREIGYEGWGQAPLIISKTDQTWGFFHDLDWYGNRINGEYDGDQHLYMSDVGKALLKTAWTDASNYSQWKKE